MSDGDWKEWGNHVLKELDRLHEGQDSIKEKQEDHGEILIGLEKDVKQNTKDLEEHQKVSAGNSLRVAELEKPSIALSQVKKWATAFTIIVGGIIAIVLKLKGFY